MSAVEIPTVPRYCIKLTSIFEKKSLLSQQKNSQKQLYKPKSVNLRSNEH